MSQGRLLHIHTAARTGRPMAAHDAAVAVAGAGIEGDRYANTQGKYSRFPGVREVTLFEIEVIRDLKDQHGIDMLPHEHRRNLTTEGVELEQLIGITFQIGDVQLEGLRPCRPCRYLNMMSKKQISARLTDRAGLYCRIITGGKLSIGDPITTR